MSETVLYREQLPKYVFKGSSLKRSSIKKTQWVYRLGAVAIFLGTLYLVISPKTEHDFAPVWAGTIAAWMGCILLVYSSEFRYQIELDGNTPTMIYEDLISIPQRIHRKLLGKSNFIRREEIDHVEIIRGRGNQYASGKCRVRWKDAPIGLKIVTKTGKKIGLGYKPPSTVKEITDVLTNHWNIRVEDAGSGMGRGTRYINDRIIGEYSYDEIMKMNLFEWQ